MHAPLVGLTQVCNLLVVPAHRIVLDSLIDSLAYRRAMVAVMILLIIIGFVLLCLLLVANNPSVTI